MNYKDEKISKSKYVTYLAILLAFVIIFQVFGGYIKIGATSLSLVLVPVVLGGIILGPLAGLLLGIAFSAVVIIMGLFGADSFTQILLSDAPVGTILVVAVKGALCGFLPALVYRALSQRNKTVATFLSAFLAPTINTLTFVVGMLMMSDVISSNFVPSGMTVIYFLVIVCAGVNFLVELALNMVLSPSIIKLSQIIGKEIRR